MRENRRFLFAFGIWRITFFFFTTVDLYTQLPGRKFYLIDFEVEG